ncbi:hypothetical protein L1887_00758 [Cichorium endivia]|nr:hypothetical protein L1887_00758 [Cichorium endivia]
MIYLSSNWENLGAQRALPTKQPSCGTNPKSNHQLPENWKSSTFKAIGFKAKSRQGYLPRPPQVLDPLLQYHNAALLTDDISVKLIWYRNFKPSQKAIITDFITSLSSALLKSHIQPFSPHGGIRWTNIIQKRRNPHSD